VDRPALNQPADLWLVDGSLRDVYVFNAVSSDWDAFLALARTYPYEYTLDGIRRSLPDTTSIFRDREHSHLLSLVTSSVRMNCHFFVPEEIELDIDPREITESEDHIAVLQFVEKLAAATRKDAVVTLENSPHVQLLRYQQASQFSQVHESRANSDA
jgi:hypothetical protein